MLVEFPRIIITGIRTGQSAKTGNAWGRLQFFDGQSNWDVFIPAERLAFLEGLEVGRSYESMHFSLEPSYSGGINMIPTL